MADSDRSRSPVPGRNRAEPRGPVQPVRQELPFFSSLVRTYASGCLALTANVTTSVSNLSSTCNSRELIFRINPRAKLPLSCRAHGPIHAFHLHLRHHLHQLLHIQFHLALPLHLAHLPCLVHQPRLPHPALHPFCHLNLVMLALHI